MNTSRNCLSICAALAVVSASAADYRVVAHYMIGGDSSAYDYIKVDPVARRLYVAHQKRFEVLDADSGAKVGEVGPVTRGHGVAVVRETGHGFATSGIDDLITMFDLQSLATLKQVKSTGSGPDSIEYDPSSKCVYAANHISGEVTVLDPVTGEVVATVMAGGTKLECVGFDGRGQGFVNDETPNLIRVFDTKTFKLKASWSVAPGDGPTGLCVDGEHHRIFSACANKMIVVLDSDTGKVVATVAGGFEPDGMAFDPKAGRIFTPNIDGTLTIIQQDSPDKYSPLATVKTKAGCKTIGFDEKTGRVFTAAPDFGPTPAPVKDGGKPKAPIIPGTFDVGGKPKAPIIPGTFEVLVIGQ